MTSILSIISFVAEVAAIANYSKKLFCRKLKVVEVRLKSGSVKQQKNEISLMWLMQRVRFAIEFDMENTCNEREKKNERK